MSVANWQQLKSLFHAALEIAPDERAAFLAASCADEVTRRQIEKLLESHEAAGDFLVSPAMVEAGIVNADPVPDVEEQSRGGQRIGAYEIVREIGRGGMGTVFLAVRRDDHYRQQVAIKIVNRGMDTDAILHRFVMERQILANLAHPNIAQLLDGGTTADGLPYFVMGYIEGQPITFYCDARQLTIVERLELFRSVCAALHYAHQNLVVHRDIKPGNILVTAEGVPMLLDFGIAKLLSPNWESGGDATLSMIQVLTPEYASPEQLRGLPITTATDVYSLGVVLYEVLSGHRPAHLTSYAQDELARMILREEPLKPSAVVATTEQARSTETQQVVFITPESVGRTRELTVEKLRRRLAGDLDNIVLKALRTEPQRRYGSVQELSEDIRRHLAGLPVNASADSLSYRVTKFVKRHRAGVAASALMVLVMLSATIITTWQAIIARRERARAEQRFNQVRKLANTVLFDYHERIKNLPGSTETRQKLVTDALDYLNNLARDSDDSPDLQREIALAYQKVGEIQGEFSDGANTGQTNAALENFRKALVIQEHLVAQTPESDADRRTLAKLYLNVGTQLEEKGDSRGREEMSGRAVAIFSNLARKNLQATMPRADLAGALFSLAAAVRARGDYDGAIDSYRQAADIYEKLALDETEPEKRTTRRRNAALTYKYIGGVFEQKHEPSSALELYRQASAIDVENAAANPSNVQYQLDSSFSFNSVASVLIDSGSLAEAQESCQKALAIQQAVASADAKNTFAQTSLARTYRRMGDILAKLGNTDQALTSYQKSIRMFEELAKADPGNVSQRAKLAEIYSTFGSFLFNSEGRHDPHSLSRLREAQSFQKRGVEIFLALKSQKVLNKDNESKLSDAQMNLQRTENELITRSTARTTH